jgi:hypothetical protein
MSSHHFVKEGQEPAILILDPVSFHTVESMLEWSPLIIVADLAVEVVLTWGIKIDVVISDTAATESMLEKLMPQTPVEFLHFASAADPATTAIEFLINTRHSAVAILASNPPALFDRLALVSHSITITVLNHEIRWSRIASGGYKKWLAKNTEIWIKGIHHLPPSVLDALGADRFKVVADGFLLLTQDDLFWVGEAL